MSKVWSVKFWSSLIILSLSHSWSLTVFLDQSSFRSRKEEKAKGKEGRQWSRREEQDQVASTGILVGNLLHVWFPSWLGHEWLCMLVYGSLVVDVMVLSRYDYGFQPSFASDVYISFELWFTGWVSKSRADMVSSFNPKGLGIPWPILAGYRVNIDGEVSI